MRYNHCILVRVFKNNNLIAEKVYSPETSLNFIKAKIKEEKAGFQYEIVCRSDFVIEKIES